MSSTETAGILPAAAESSRRRPGATGALESPGIDAGIESLVCLGLSYRTAPLALRERLALAPATVTSILSRFGCAQGDRPAGVSELVILSTCNRLELYAAAGAEAPCALLDLIAGSTGVSAEELTPAVYTISGAPAVRHLCRVAAGLESMVVGEPQILGQIGKAFSTALANRAAGHTLTTLFRGALRAGRRARAETKIGAEPATVSSVAVRLVSEAVDDLASASVLVVGAGEMSEQTLAALHYRGVRDVCVVSRTREHAIRLAARFTACAEPFERLATMLAGADVVITSTSAPHHVIAREMVDDAMRVRRGRKMTIIDIAVPRDVAPDARSTPGVRYVDLDDLECHAYRNLEARERELPAAESIIDEEAEICIAAMRRLEIEPVIADLRAHADAVRREALARARKHFAHLDDDDRMRLEAFSESLVNRLFHEPTARLRDQARTGQGAGYAMALRHLFGLTE